MTLLAPWALWFSVTGLAVVALYLLKIRRRRQVVPALDFWRQLVSQTEIRSLFQRLKRWLSLLLWLVIVTCLVLALGNPILSLGSIRPESIALVVDNSASMQTIEAELGGKTRLELALDAVAEITERRPVNDEWLLIEAAAQPAVRAAWTRDRKAVRDAASAVTPHRGAGDLRGAVDLAKQLLHGKDRARVVVLSDGAAGALTPMLEDPPFAPPYEGGEGGGKDQTLTYWPLGRTDDNLGLTHLRVRRHRQQSAHYAYVRVVNASAADVETQVVFSIDDATTKVEPVRVASGASWETTFVFDRPQGGVLRAAIDRPDALAVDNTAYAILEPIEPLTVFLVSPPDEAFFFQQVLVAMDYLVDPETSQVLTPADYAKLGSLRDAADLTVFNHHVPDAWPDTGQFVFVGGWPPELPARSIGELELPRMELVAAEHPLTQYLNVGAVNITRARQVDLLEPQTVLARSDRATPLIFLHEEPDRQALCIAFDVLESDLPFRNAFPMLLRNAVSYLGAERTRWIHPNYSIGAAIEPLRRLPPDLEQVQVAKHPGNADAEHSLPVDSGRFEYSDTGEVGALRFQIGDESSYTAVNLTEPAESQIRPLAAPADPRTQLALSGTLGGFVPWLAMALAAALLVTLEWWTYHLRWTE